MNLRALDLHNAEITRISSRKDGSISFGCETPELASDAKAAFFELHGKLVRILIAPHEEENPATIEVVVDKDIKTPSQCLRAAIWKHFKDANIKLSFQEFYARQMARIVEGYEAKHSSQ